MKIVLLTTLLSIAVGALGTRTQDDASAAELKKLRGVWSIVEEIDDGKHMPAAEARKNKLTFDEGGRWKVEIDGKVVGEGTATIDPSKKPKTIDYTFTSGATFFAIYDLNDDSFKHCGVLKGARPSEFSSTPGSGQILTIFRRVTRE